MNVGSARDLKISVQLTFGSHIDRLNANVYPRKRFQSFSFFGGGGVRLEYGKFFLTLLEGIGDEGERMK